MQRPKWVVRVMVILVLSLLLVGWTPWAPEDVGQRIRRECESIIRAAVQVAVFGCLVQSATKGRQ
jgi:hypothetical protein